MKEKSMSNVLKQVQREVNKFKSKHIAPQVLVEMVPKFKADYEEAMETYRKTDQYKTLVARTARRELNRAVYDLFNHDSIRRRIAKAVEQEVLKEIIDGNK